MIEPIHVVPEVDIIAHEASSECVCSPTLEVYGSDQGRYIQIYQHHALEENDNSQS